MLYKMEQKIRFEISRKAENLHRELLEVPCNVEHLYIQVEMEEEFRYMSFIIVEDPDGNIRLQKQLAWGEQNLAIGDGPESTTIGGVPGKIQPGIWKISLGIFTEYLNQKLGDQEGQILMTVSGENGKISDPIMGKCWVEHALTISPEKYRWDEVHGTKKNVV